MIKGALKIMNGIPKPQSQLVDNCSLRRVQKVAFDEFTAGVRVYVDCDHQTFFQAVDSRFNIRNVMVGPCDLVRAVS